MKIDQIEKILKLRAQRHTHHQISVITGYSTRAVIRVLLKHQIEFAARDASIMELCFYKTGISEGEQSFYRATMLSRLEDELNRRPLSDVPIPTLAKMVIAAHKSPWRRGLK